ncbi:MAG: HAMP domain-containing protein [candidate division Zixibacteria bacterium]|nr:HAMP domain-containing protein [candidate division Zixibacteria bacterium]
MRLRLAQKIMLMIALVVVVSITGVTIITIVSSSQSMTDLAKTDLAHMAQMGVNQCQIAAEEARQKAELTLAMAGEKFSNWSAGNVYQEGNRLVVGQDVVLNRDHQLVDNISSQTGAIASVFIDQGTTATRITTSLKNDRGERVLNTHISDEVYNTVVRQGQDFVGRAWVVDEWYVSAYQPIRDNNNKIIGALGVALPEASKSLRENLLAMEVGKTGYIYAIDSKGVLRVHPAKEGADISKYEFIQEITHKGPQLAKGQVEWIQYGWKNAELGDTKERDKIVVYAYFPDWDWIVAVGSYLEEFVAPVNDLRNTLIMFGLLALVVSIGLGYFIARSIAKPMVSLAGVAEAVAVGDVSQKVEVRSQDEIGDLGRSFNNMMDYFKESARVAEKIAQNDLRVEFEPRSDQDVMGHSFKSMIENLTRVISRLSASSEELVSAATEIASTSEQMSRGSQSQADQISQISTAVEEMSATINESAKHAEEATQASRGASETATTGGQIVADTVQGMQSISYVVTQSSEQIGELAKSANEIGEIISVINDIADQTNLLALNAAIEAARAGEQGRGFAVVADEVRKLAERTGKATGEIASMVQGIQKATDRSVTSMQSGIEEVSKGKQLADKAGESLEGIVTMSQSVMDMIQQIAAATEEQSVAAEQITKSIDGIASVTKETASGSEQAAVAAEQLSRQAEGLKDMISSFKIK